MQKMPFVSFEKLQEITAKYPTPFHLYDETGIRRTARGLADAFSWNDGFREYFAIKAWPNPYILQILKEEGYVCSVTPVLAVVFEDKPGALVNVLNLLGDNGINLEYSYAFLAKRANSACMIFRVADNEAAIKVLTANGLKPICQDDLESMFK